MEIDKDVDAARDATADQVPRQTPRRGRTKRSGNGRRGAASAIAEVTPEPVPGRERRTRRDTAALRRLLAGLRDLQAGDFSVRLSRTSDPLMAEIGDAFNAVAELKERMLSEIARVSETVGQQGDLTARLSLPGARGGAHHNPISNAPNSFFSRALSNFHRLLTLLR